MPRPIPAPARLMATLLACAWIAGCAQFPELDAALTEEGRLAPELELTDNRPLIAAAAGGTIDDSTQTTLQARAAALQGRSTGLAGPVLSPDERAEIETAHDRLRQTTARVAPEG